MENEQGNKIEVYSEKKSSNAVKVLLIVLGVVMVSVISSVGTFFVLIGVLSGGESGSNITYKVESVENPVVAVANIGLPSVVGIKIDYFEQNFFGQLDETYSEGSGIVYTSDGYIITNNHVIEEAADSSSATITVTLYDGTEYEAKIIGRDETTDLALIKIDAKDLKAAKFGDSSEISVGELAVAIGNPLGQEFSGSVTVGYVSALNRSLTIDGTSYKLIQTDAAINPGNSGGALLNAKGEVIGINSAKITTTAVEGLGFAIPSNDALTIIEELKVNGKIIRPYIGIKGISLDEQTAKRNKLVEGVYVAKAYTNAPAGQAGIQKGDIIVEFDGEKVKTIDELNILKNQKKIGDTVSLKIYRSGKYEDVVLTLTSDEQAFSDDVTN